MKKTVRIISAILLVAVIAFGYFRFYYVFGEGVKSGTLNFVVKKGVVFKTYEGILIQSGFRSGLKTGTIQSYEFAFSIANKDLAKELMLMGGQEVELSYKEYFGRLPWRGYTKYIVDGIIKTTPPGGNPGTDNKPDTTIFESE